MCDKIAKLGTGLESLFPAESGTVFDFDDGHEFYGLYNQGKTRVKVLSRKPSFTDVFWLIETHAD